VSDSFKDMLPSGSSDESEGQLYIAIDRESGKPCNIVDAESVNSPWARRYRFIPWSEIERALGEGE